MNEENQPSDQELTPSRLYRVWFTLNCSLKEWPGTVSGLGYPITIKAFTAEDALFQSHLEIEQVCLSYDREAKSKIYMAAFYTPYLRCSPEAYAQAMKEYQPATLDKIIRIEPA